MTHPTPSSESATKDRTRTGPKPKLARQPRPRINENKNASATKSGPGRFHREGKPGNRLSKQKPLRAYRAAMAFYASKRVPTHRNMRGMGLL